jgi:hypothetical protein
MEWTYMRKIIMKFRFNIAMLSTGIIVGICIMAKICKRPLTEQKNRGDKNGRLYRLCCRWLNTAIDNDNNVESQLAQKEINSVAIYGMGGLGECLLKELTKNGISVRYIIDSRANMYVEKYNLPIYLPEDNLPDVQAVIVTPVYDFEVIKGKLVGKINAEIISIEDLV